MGSKTKIQWTDATWNPTRGCSRISPGCEHCYAERVAARFSKAKGDPYHGFAQFSAKRRLPQWTGKLAIVSNHLLDPLRWAKPRRVFVNSMSDVFHENLSDDDIAAIFGVMASAPKHTFQILTKRAARMHEWFKRFAAFGGASQPIRAALTARRYVDDKRLTGCHGKDIAPWPLPNVWLGVSAESQAYADERIPMLLRTPAALRFVSYEPALGPLNLDDDWMYGRFIECPDETPDEPTDPCLGCSAIPGDSDLYGAIRGSRLDWIIVGGESGHGARLFHTSWARAVIDQCRAARIACFVKQLGADVRTDGIQRAGDWWPSSGGGFSEASDGIGFYKHLADPKGGNPSEWQPSLRVQEFPPSDTHSTSSLRAARRDLTARRRLAERAGGSET